MAGMSHTSEFDISGLFAAIDANPSPLLDHLVPVLEGLHGKARRTKRELRFGSRGSLSIRLPDGRWFDHESQAGGGLWKLAKSLGWQTEDIARLYGLEQGPPSPARRKRLHVQAEANRRNRRAAQSSADEALDHAVKLCLDKAESVDGGVQSYLDGRGIGHLADRATIKAIRRPTVLGQHGLYNLPERCLGAFVTDDEGDVRAIALTRLTGTGAKIEPAAKARYSLGPIGRGYARLGGAGGDTLVMVEGVEDAGTVSRPDVWPDASVLASIGGIRIIPDGEIAAARKIVIAVDRDLIAYKKSRKPGAKPAPRKLSRILRQIRDLNPSADVYVARPDRGTEGATADLNDVLNQNGPGRVRECLERARLVIKGRGVPDDPGNSPIDGRDLPRATTGSFRGPTKNGGTNSPTETKAEVVDLAAKRLQRALARELDQIDLIKTVKDRRAEIVRPVHDRIEVEMEVKWGDAALDGQHPDHQAFRADKKKAKAAATRLAGKQAVAEAGLVKMPKAKPLIIVKATTGLGKSKIAIEEVGKPRAARFDWLAPSHRLLDQAESDFAETSTKPHTRAAGRGSESVVSSYDWYHGRWEKSWNPRLMCPRAEVVSVLARVGLNVNNAICPSCPLRDICEYQRQKQRLKAVTDNDGVVFAPSAYAQHVPIWRRADVTVIDESFLDSLFKTRTVKADILNSRDAIWRLCKAEDVDDALYLTDHIRRALLDHRGAPLAYLDSVGIGKNELKRLIKAMTEGQAKDDRIDGTLSDDALKARVEAIASAGRFEIMSIARAFIMAIKTGAKRVPQIANRQDDNGNDVLEITECALIKIGKKRPIICLDATVDTELLEMVTGRKATVIEETVPENLELTVVDTSGSKTALYAAEDEEGGLVGMMCAFEKFAAGKPCPIFTHKETEERWLDEFGANMPVEHYGGLVGLNTYKDVDRLIILGRQQPNEAAFLPKAAAVAATKGREVATVESWLDQHPEHRDQKRRDGYVNRPDGNGGFFNAAWHPDPVIEAMRWRACEGELIQAMGRARSIRAEIPVKVLIVTNVVPDVGGRLARTISFREFKAGKLYDTALEEYTQRLISIGNMVPLGPSDMAALAPDLFSNAKSAKNALLKIKGLPSDLISMRGGSPFFESTYRRRGQRGSACRALIKSGISAAIVRGELERLVGPLAAFDHPENDNEIEWMAS